MNKAGVIFLLACASLIAQTPGTLTQGTGCSSGAIRNGPASCTARGTCYVGSYRCWCGYEEKVFDPMSFGMATDAFACPNSATVHSVVMQANIGSSGIYGTRSIAQYYTNPDGTVGFTTLMYGDGYKDCATLAKTFTYTTRLNRGANCR